MTAQACALCPGEGRDQRLPRLRLSDRTGPIAVPVTPVPLRLTPGPTPNGRTAWVSRRTSRRVSRAACLRSGRKLRSTQHVRAASRVPRAAGGHGSRVRAGRGSQDDRWLAAAASAAVALGHRQAHRAVGGTGDGGATGRRVHAAPARLG